MRPNPHHLTAVQTVLRKDKVEAVWLRRWGVVKEGRICEKINLAGINTVFGGKENETTNEVVR